MSGPSKAQLRALYAQGKQAWPDVHVEADAFFDHVNARMGADSADVERVNAGDLYLACACAAGNATAIAILDEQYIMTLDSALTAVQLTSVSADDVKQLLRVRLFTADGDRAPRIGDYSGLGRLAAFIRVAAVRLAIDLRRKHGREVASGDTVLAALPAQRPTPELEAVRSKYRDEFEAAVRAAFAAITPRERNLLRHQVIDQLSIDRIGALYGVHRATAARWVARARESLIDHVKNDLESRLRVSREDLESLFELIRSHVDVSIRGLLAQDDA